MESDMSFFQKLKNVIEEHDTAAGRNFDILIQIFIFISLITFSLETIPGISEDLQRVLNITEIITVSIFSIEYILRIIVADKRLKFIFSFYGLVDLLAILPFYLSVGVDLRTIRILRFLRIFRLIKLTRYNAASRRFALALKIAREEIIMFLFVSATMIYIAAVGIYYFENEAQPETFASVFHSLWWSVITLTTVGYGDVYPITMGGRVDLEFQQTYPSTELDLGKQYLVMLREDNREVDNKLYRSNHPNTIQCIGVAHIQEAMTFDNGKYFDVLSLLLISWE